YGFERPIVRDAQGRITREGGWTFDPATGRCIGDASDRSGRGQPYWHMCFGCHRRSGWVHSSEPPPLSSWAPSDAQREAHETGNPVVAAAGAAGCVAEGLGAAAAL
ncbi:hypothetical protein B0H14DRAFT_3704865, partial [Mycena olivaceomarginata]